MSIDRKGDPAKQPPECASVFTPWGPDNPKPRWADGEGQFSKCPNLAETGGGMAGEIWECAVCGEKYYLDYDDMR